MVKREFPGFIIALFFSFIPTVVGAQVATWSEASRQTDSLWLESPEARAVADSLVKYQLPGGGWVKNEDWLDGSSHASWLQAVRTGLGATIDNGATWQELRFLARVAHFSPRAQWLEALDKGIALLLAQQYPNGGMPQFLPPKPGDYSSHITFNDGAMVGALRIFRDVALRCPPFDLASLSDELRIQCSDALRQGIDCILQCQIKDAQGTLTVWGQQHDENTLLPAPARAYELAAYCAGSETVDLLRFLMELPDPDDRVRQAIISAMEWLEAHALHDKRLRHFTNTDNLPDRELVDDPGAPLLWARFYDLENALPFVCDRDGVPKPSLSQIGYERRNGYAWYGNQPLSLFPLFRQWEAENGK